MIGTRSTTTSTTTCATTTPSPRDLAHLSSSKSGDDSSDSDSSSPRSVGGAISAISESDVADKLMALLKREERGYRYQDCVGRYLQRQRVERAKDEMRDLDLNQDQDLNQDHGRRRDQGREEDRGGPMIPPLNPSWRADICSWVFRVVDEHRVLPNSQDGGLNNTPMTTAPNLTTATTHAPVLGNEIAIATMSYLDRYLVSAHGNVCGERTVLLACLAALRLATKLYSPVPFEMGFFLWVGRGQFTSADVEAMERDVLTELGWHVHPPTGVDFAFHLVELLSCCCSGGGSTKDPNPISSGMTGEVLARATRFLTGATTSDPFFVPLGSSSVALAAVINAMEDVGMFDLLHARSGLAFLDRLASLPMGGGGDDEGKNLPRYSPSSPEVQAARCRLIEMERAMYERQRASTSGSGAVEDQECHWITP